MAGRAVETWFDNAYLKATYPTASFPDAFASFSPGAATIAVAPHALARGMQVGCQIGCGILLESFDKDVAFAHWGASCGSPIRAFRI